MLQVDQWHSVSGTVICLFSMFDLCRANRHRKFVGLARQSQKTQQEDLYIAQEDMGLTLSSSNTFTGDSKPKNRDPSPRRGRSFSDPHTPTRSRRKEDREKEEDREKNDATSDLDIFCSSGSLLLDLDWSQGDSPSVHLSCESETIQRRLNKKDSFQELHTGLSKSAVISTNTTATSSSTLSPAEGPFQRRRSRSVNGPLDPSFLSSAFASQKEEDDSLFNPFSDSSFPTR